MTLSELAGGSAGGVFRYRVGAPIDPGSAQGLRRVQVQSRNTRDKLAFLRRTAEALNFPDYFGHNWDAFYDCLTDLAGAGQPLLIEFDDLSGFARVDPEEFAAAVDTLRDAVEYWSETNGRLIVLIGVDEPLLATELEEISAG
jgi:RNAse (barnase) inhibitor barstar